MQNIVTWGQKMSANIEEFACISMGGLFSGVPPYIKLYISILTFSVSISNGNIKYPMGKSIFAVNLPFKLFRVSGANADTESLKSLDAFLKIYLPYSSEI